MFRDSQPAQKRMSQLERYKKVYSSTSKSFNPISGHRGSYFKKFKAIIDKDQEKWKIPTSIEHNDGINLKLESLVPVFKDVRKKTSIKTCSNFDSQKKLLVADTKIPIEERKSKRKSQNIYHTTLIRKTKDSFFINPNKNIFNYQQFKIVGEQGEGNHIWGKMQINQTLGSGAYGLVKSGTHNGMDYAIKIYEKYKLIDAKKRKRVFTQISLLRKLSPHQNVIQFYQAFQNKQQIHMILQFLPSSVTLLDYFRKKFLKLSLQSIQKIFSKIVAGVAHLHFQGIAHRDIKPQNVLIQEDDQIRIKIIDFGFATKALKTDLQCGTPNFMAPELFSKFEKKDSKKTDIWALGVTLFYLCESRYPFKGFDQRNLSKIIKLGKYQVTKTTDENILDIMSRTLVVNPNQRMTITQLLEHPFMYKEI